MHWPFLGTRTAAGKKTRLCPESIYTAVREGGILGSKCCEERIKV